MCLIEGPVGLTRRDFLRLTAAGSALLLAPGGGAALERRATGGAFAEGPFLDAALAADRWIRAFRRETEAGVTWPVVPAAGDDEDLSLYHGTPGVLLFLLEVHAATGSSEALDDAVAGADHLLARTDASPDLDPGLYTGLSGIAFCLEAVHRASGEARFREGAVRCMDRVVGAARRHRGGLAWAPGSLDQASSDIISGAAGIGLTLLWAHEALDHPAALEVAAGAGRRLVGLGAEDSGGLCWLVSLGYPRNYPNFSHGTAGVAYFLARLHAATGASEPLDAAVRGARYLHAVGRCDSDGCAVFHHEPGGEELYYLSWCHGPVGTARLFEALARATGDSDWRGWISRGAAAIQGYGVPEVRSPGYWNNVSQCCGDAGVGEFFLALEGAIGDQAHGAYAERVGRWLLGQSSEDAGGRRWVQAENRVSPDEVAAQTGRMQGAAGVGTFLLHLDGRRAGRTPAVVLPDSPWWS